MIIIKDTENEYKLNSLTHITIIMVTVNKGSHLCVLWSRYDDDESIVPNSMESMLL